MTFQAHNQYMRTSAFLVTSLLETCCVFAGRKSGSWPPRVLDNSLVGLRLPVPLSNRAYSACAHTTFILAAQFTSSGTLRTHVSQRMGRVEEHIGRLSGDIGHRCEVSQPICAAADKKKNHEQVRSTGLGVFRSCRLKAYFGTMINGCHEVRDRSRPSATQKKHLATNSTHFAAKWGGNSSITLEVTFRHRRVCGRPARLIERARNSWPCADSQRGLRGYVFQHKVEMHSALVGRSRRPADKSH